MQAMSNMQACTADGTVYDITNIVPYVQKFKRHPVSGEPLLLRDIIQLHFHKNADNEYHDPILHKVCHARMLRLVVVFGSTMTPSCTLSVMHNSSDL